MEQELESAMEQELESAMEQGLESAMEQELESASGLAPNNFQEWSSARYRRRCDIVRLHQFSLTSA